MGAIVGVLAVAGVAAGGYWYYKKQQEAKSPPKQAREVQIQVGNPLQQGSNGPPPYAAGQPGPVQPGTV